MHRYSDDESANSCADSFSRMVTITGSVLSVGGPGRCGPNRFHIVFGWSANFRTKFWNSANPISAPRPVLPGSPMRIAPQQTKCSTLGPANVKDLAESVERSGALITDAPKAAELAKKIAAM